MLQCPAEIRYGEAKHLFIVVYHRPWRRFFRKTNVLRCWKCNLRISEF
jgi:hypothetical protein